MMAIEPKIQNHTWARARQVCTLVRVFEIHPLLLPPCFIASIFSIFVLIFLLCHHPYCNSLHCLPPPSHTSWLKGLSSASGFGVYSGRLTSMPKDVVPRRCENSTTSFRISVTVTGIRVSSASCRGEGEDGYSDLRGERKGKEWGVGRGGKLK